TQHQSLAQRVLREVHDVDATAIEDACGYAWLQLTRRTDISLDRRGMGWLSRVAVHEAWRLLQADESCASDPVDGRAPMGLAAAVGDPLERALDVATHRERVAHFATLKPRERRDLILHAGGFRYREIAHLTGSSYTAVNRRVSEGRRRLYVLAGSSR
ncbi:RNA polymerase sigma factor, partial [Paraburkholderia sp. BR10954]|uniref:RNA polymerase sigma factor n=1 Tax=Paraburkholderia sp. BR10954 TaxID=3236995 RepID=UPI0034D26228